MSQHTLSICCNLHRAPTDANDDAIERLRQHTSAYASTYASTYRAPTDANDDAMERLGQLNCLLVVLLREAEAHERERRLTLA